MIANLAVGFVALLHFYILVLEMFFWTKAPGMRAFGMTPEKARDSAVLAANQGLYNGFLAAGLVWGLVHPDLMFGLQVKLFFLGCIAIAGLYGAVTAKRSILFVQTVPAAITVVLLLV